MLLKKLREIRIMEGRRLRHKAADYKAEHEGMNSRNETEQAENQE